MIETSSARILVEAMNLLVIGSPVLASQGPHVTATDQKVERLNIASLNSIEKTWLAVPDSCKARAFNASPVPIENKEVASHIQDIYTSFGV